MVTGSVRLPLGVAAHGIRKGGGEELPTGQRWSWRQMGESWGTGGQSRRGGGDTDCCPGTAAAFQEPRYGEWGWPSGSG